MSSDPDAFFMPVADHVGGHRFCLLHPGRGATKRGSVLYVHPFAEEMNKSRRMASMQARALAQAGYDVLQVDLRGCGDSAGDFGDASWNGWIDDVVRAASWLRAQGAKGTGSLEPPSLWLWGLRAGCLLAAQAAAQMPCSCNFVFWQPTPAGKILLQQFLRLKVAGDMLDREARGGMEKIRALLASGHSVEVAGYQLTPELAAGLEKAVLEPPTYRSTGRLRWLEVSAREDAQLGPASTRSIARWQQAGFDVSARLIVGPAFWQTTEIEDAPALIEATLAAMDA